jgi:hypothetical protein
MASCPEHNADEKTKTKTKTKKKTHSHTKEIPLSNAMFRMPLIFLRMWPTIFPETLKPPPCGFSSTGGSLYAATETRETLSTFSKNG